MTSDGVGEDGTSAGNVSDVTSVIEISEGCDEDCNED